MKENLGKIEKIYENESLPKGVNKGRIVFPSNME